MILFLGVNMINLNTIKRSVITRGITDFQIDRLKNNSHVPQLGDVAVFEVISLGKHKAIQAVDETITAIYPGDLILAAFGGRYASNQFEGYVPCEPTLDLQILGQGGAVGQLVSTHNRFKKTGGTQIRLLGYATDRQQQVINTRYQRLERVAFDNQKPSNAAIYLSIGASMDSGKTTTAAHFARGAMLSGKTVAYIKLTGTAYSKDRRTVRDSGAAVALDFSHCGYPSTFQCSTEEVLAIYATLLQQVKSCHPDIIIVEIADGLLQKETNNLLKHQGFMSGIDGVVLSCPDSLSVYGGLQILQSMAINPLIISGIFTASPLMINEVAGFTTTPIFSLADFTAQGRLLTALSQPDYQQAGLCVA